MSAITSTNPLIDLDMTERETLRTLISEAEPVALAYLRVASPVEDLLAGLLIAYLDERVNTESLDDPFADIAEHVTDALIAEAVSTVARLLADKGPAVIAHTRDAALTWMSRRPDRAHARRAARAKRRALRIARKASEVSAPAAEPVTRSYPPLAPHDLR